MDLALPGFWDRDGCPMELLDWAKAFGDVPGRTLALTQVDDTSIITVWLGVDEDDEVPPRIFGSIAMTSGEYHDEIRACTQAEAMEAHARLVQRCRCA